MEHLRYARVTGKNAYEPVLEALELSSEVLMTDEKPEPGWFSASGNLMHLAIMKRDRRQQEYNEQPTADNKVSLLEAR